MEADERFYNKRIGYVQSCIHTKYGIPLHSISLNWNTKHVLVKGVKTCQDGSLKFSKYQYVEDEFDELMQKWQTKTHRNDCEQS